MSVFIVVADANEAIRRILDQALAHSGFTALDAPNGKVALVKSLQFRPQALLIDYFSGIDWHKSVGDLLYPITTLRRNSITAQTPILVKCPALGSEQLERLLAAGATEIIFKPVKLGQLLALLHKHVDPQASAREQKAQARDAKAQRSLEEIAELLRSPAAMANEKIEAAVSAAKQLLALPFVVARALRISADEVSGAKELGECIASDSAISASLLKVANTVFFARKGRRISDLAEAVVRIGFRETRKMVICMNIFNLFQGPARGAAFNRMDFWLHALATAVVAEHLAEQARYPRPSDAFIGGLFHDIGKILLDDFFPDILDDILQQYLENTQPFEAAEKAVMGITHAQLGAALLEAWSLPESIQHGAFYHHDLERAATALSGEKRLLAELVATANLLAKALGLGHGGNFTLTELPPEHWKRIGLEHGLPRDLLERIRKQVAVYCEILEVPLTGMDMNSGAPASEPVPPVRPRVLLALEMQPPVSFADILLRRHGCTVSLKHRVFPVPPPSDYDIVLTQGAGQADDAPNVVALELPFNALELAATIAPDRAPAAAPAAPDAADQARQDQLKRLLRAASRLPPGLNLEELDHDFHDSIQALRERESNSRRPVKNGAGPRKKTVLYFDADEDGRARAKLAFERAGFDAHLPQNLAEALALLDTRPPLDLVILDPDLPGTGGTDFLLRLRRDLARVPLIFCSPRHDREAVQSALRLGIRDYIVKPYQTEAFIERLWRVLSVPRPG